MNKADVSVYPTLVSSLIFPDHPDLLGLTV